MTRIKKATLRHALGVLNAQYKHCEDGDEKQATYYEGMRAMLEIIVSDAYTQSNYVVGAKKHYILYESGELFTDAETMQILSAK